MTRHWLHSSLMTLLVTLLAVSDCAGASKKRAVQVSIEDVKATVISLRRYESSTYLEVLRDDGTQEWIEVNREKGLTARPDQRIVYSTRSKAHANESFGMIRYGVDFSIIPHLHDDRIYQGSSSDGVIILTDNPSPDLILKDSFSAVRTESARKYPKNKNARQADVDEIVVVESDELLKKKEMEDKFYQYMSDNKESPRVRKAKRAKPWQQ